jgi:hypothetical protein
MKRRPFPCADMSKKKKNLFYDGVTFVWLKFLICSTRRKKNSRKFCSNAVLGDKAIMEFLSRVY